MAPNAEPEKDFPWWLVILAVTGLWLLYKMLADPFYAGALTVLSKGLVVTLSVAVVAYLGACAIGLGLAMMGMSKRVILRQVARLYIEVMRGVPIIVLLLYVAFALVPFAVLIWGGLDLCLNAAGTCVRGIAPEGDGWLARAVAAMVHGLAWMVDWIAIDLPDLRTRDVPLLWRAVFALMLAYSAFLAEIFRAGLQAVDKGQIEAAQALGLNGWQRFRHVRFPQAFRLILPPLGNDFVAMVKDSSLVAVLGISDVAQLAKVTAAGNFRYFETYNVAAFLYLVMTIGLSLVLRRFEARMRSRGRDAN
jgi:polar amino acid transport system permease protein